MGKTEIIIILILFSLIFIAFLVTITVYIVQYKAKKKQHNALLQMQYETFQKELLTAQLEIQQQTMQHIGREIHDNIGQKLTLASLYTQQLAYENKAPQIIENIEGISAIINESLSELRELSKSLTNDAIASANISTLLQQECNRINESKMCSVHFSSTSKSMQADYPSKSVLLRCTQEFIQNSIKHAHCKNISIALGDNDKLLTLTLTDDGHGFDTNQQQTNGIGLNNMKKRVEIIGGQYNLQSNTNGTRLIIEIPLQK